MANYPDILGAITGGKHATQDFADLAFGLRPTAPLAGRVFEAILLIQNTTDSPIDARVKLIIPDKDSKGARDQFVTKADKPLLIGLNPAEVGYVALPVMARPTATPGPGYQVQVVVEITSTEKTPARVRTGGDWATALDSVPAAKRDVIEPLRGLTFNTEPQPKAPRNSLLLAAPFTLNTAGVSKLGDVPKAGWTSLWTVADTAGAEGLADQARRYTSVVSPQLTRGNVFFPLMRALQDAAEHEGNYRLWAGEATVIAKSLALLLETGQPVASNRTESAQHPQWFLKMYQVLIAQPDLCNQVETLVITHLLPDLLHDATVAAFIMLKTATPEDLGSPDEMDEYAQAVVKSFAGTGDPLDYTHMYLPLVLSGVLNSHRVMMPGERPLDTLELLINARIHRESERSEDNQFVFDLFDTIIDQELAKIDKSLNLQRYLDPIERLRIKK